MVYEKDTFITIPNKNHLEGKPSEMQAIFFWLCNYIDKNGKCYPSRTKLSNQCGCSIRTVDKYLKQLVEDGFVTVKAQYKEDSSRTSNLYQVQIMPNPSANESTTPSVESDRVTQSSINSTHITLLSDVPSEQIKNINVPKQEPVEGTLLPDSFGKQPLQRLARIYKLLWKDKYGSEPQLFNYARFNKNIKKLLVSFNEIQLTIIMDTYFDWKGINNDNQKDNDFLAGNGFTLELMASKVDIYLSYIKTSLHASWGSIEGDRSYARKVLKLKKII